MATSTPWGNSQHVTRYGRGVNFYSTACHGGFKVSRALNASMPDALRIESGWYEEDCDYARVIVAFPERFTPERVESAKRSLAQWNPDAYEAFYGVELLPGESFVKDERAFLVEHAGDFIVISARTAADDPTMVDVWAMRGGRPADGREAREERRFRLDAAEYDRRGRHGFVIDLERHAEVSAAAVKMADGGVVAIPYKATAAPADAARAIETAAPAAPEPGKLDGRYTIALEHTGAPQGPHHVARFCGEWIGVAFTKDGARNLAQQHNAARLARP